MGGKYFGNRWSARHWFSKATRRRWKIFQQRWSAKHWFSKPTRRRMKKHYHGSESSSEAAFCSVEELHGEKYIARWICWTSVNMLDFALPADYGREPKAKISPIFGLRWISRQNIPYIARWEKHIFHRAIPLSSKCNPLYYPCRQNIP